MFYKKDWYSRSFFFLFLVLFLVQPQKLFSASESEGFLGIDIILNWHGGSSKVDEKSILNDVLGLQIALIGSGSYYGVTTQFQVVSNIINASEQYSGSSDYIAQGEIDYFSYTSIKIQYSTWHNEYFNVLTGYGLGHLGYLSDSFEVNPYTIFISPVVSFWWFISDYFGTMIEAEFPIATYRRNASRLWHIKIKHEIVSDLGGTIANPFPNSILFALGWQFDYIKIITKENSHQNAQAIMIRPYFRFSYLY